MFIFKLNKLFTRYCNSYILIITFTLLSSCIQLTKDEVIVTNDTNISPQIKQQEVLNFLRMETIDVYKILQSYPELKILEVKNKSKKSGFRITADEIRPGLRLPVNKRTKHDYFQAKITMDDGDIIYVRL